MDFFVWCPEMLLPASIFIGRFFVSISTVSIQFNLEKESCVKMRPLVSWVERTQRCSMAEIQEEEEGVDRAWFQQNLISWKKIFSGFKIQMFCGSRQFTLSDIKIKTFFFSRIFCLNMFDLYLDLCMHANTFILDVMKWLLLFGNSRNVLKGQGYEVVKMLYYRKSRFAITIPLDLKFNGIRQSSCIWVVFQLVL